jgi:ribosomal protein L7/L12
MNASSEQIAFLSVLIVGVLLVVALLRPQLSDIQRRVAALARLEAKLDLLMKHAGIQYEPYKDLPGDVVDAVQRGEKIEAIKRYRAATGVGLKEAKDFIEEVQRRAGG